jgi:hypothetical protein
LIEKTGAGIPKAYFEYRADFTEASVYSPENPEIDRNDPR